MYSLKDNIMLRNILIKIFNYLNKSNWKIWSYYWGDTIIIIDKSDDCYLQEWIIVWWNSYPFRYYKILIKWHNDFKSYDWKQIK